MKANKQHNAPVFDIY